MLEQSLQCGLAIFGARQLDVCMRGVAHLVVRSAVPPDATAASRLIRVCDGREFCKVRSGLDRLVKKTGGLK